MENLSRIGNNFLRFDIVILVKSVECEEVRKLLARVLVLWERRKKRKS